jgi:predicted alpha/beta hydrolase family esterase
MKTVLFIPGGMEDTDSRDYSSVIKAIKKSGYKVKFIAINWKRKVISDWVAQLDAEYNKYEASEVILAGFSWGSITALVSASKRNPAELWLFSLSPFFAEDTAKFKKSWLSSIGQRRVDSFKKLSFRDTAKLISCRTLIFAGEYEVKQLVDRCSQASKTIPSSKMILVSKVGHDVADKVYIQSITANI